MHSYCEGASAPLLTPRLPPPLLGRVRVGDELRLQRGFPLTTPAGTFKPPKIKTRPLATLSMPDSSDLGLDMNPVSSYNLDTIWRVASGIILGYQVRRKEFEMETTGKAFLGHWDWAASKGLMNKNTAYGLRAACRRVLGVLDDWENVDIKEINVEETLTRFQNLRKTDFKPQVLETYKRRFRQAVSSYLSYVEDPGNWKATTRKRRRQPSINDRGATPAGKDVTGGGYELPSAGLVEYPFPLREGQNARLVLPRDLKTSEVKRLTAFMATLAVDFEETGERQV